MILRVLAFAVLCVVLLVGIAASLVAVAAEPLPNATATDLAAHAIQPQSHLFPIQVGGKWGYIDRGGTVVLKPQFDYAGRFCEDLALAKIGDKWGYINLSGKIVIEPQFKNASHFSEGLAPVRIAGCWGFVDNLGRIVIKPQFGSVGSFHEGLAWFQQDVIGDREAENRAKYGYIDRTGRIVMPPRFSYAGDFSDGLAVAAVENPALRRGVADSYTGIFSDAMALAAAENPALRYPVVDWGYIDRSGKFVIEPKYAWALPFSDGMAVVYTRDKRIEYLDRKGTFLFAACGPDGKTLIAEGTFNPRTGHEEQAYPFVEGMARFYVGADFREWNILGSSLKDCSYEDGKWGFLDKTGKVAISPQFDSASDFSEGLAIIRVKTEIDLSVPGKKEWFVLHKHGFIDYTGKIVIKPKFDHAEDFTDGLALVGTISLDIVRGHIIRKYGYIDKTGRYVWEPSN